MTTVVKITNAEYRDLAGFTRISYKREMTVDGVPREAKIVVMADGGPVYLDDVEQPYIEIWYDGVLVIVRPSIPQRLALLG